MATKDRLIGADATLYKASWGAPFTGASVAGTWYQITAISGTTLFSGFYGVGDLFLGVGAALTVTAPYSAKAATFTKVADANSFEINFNKDEIEVTTLADGVKKYRAGKSDMSGTITGINMISEMNTSGSFLNRFIRTISATAAYVSTTRAVDETDLYAQFYVQDDTTTSGETSAFLFGQIEMYGYKVGAAVGNAQEWSSNVRFIGADPIMYFKANA